MPPYWRWWLNPLLMDPYHRPITRLITADQVPDTSRVRSKMLYESSKDRFKQELDGIQVELQATDPSEMGMDIVKARAL
jgi:hypothetical protein